MENTYTKQEVIDFVEKLGYLYKYNPENKTWNMQTHLAPPKAKSTIKHYSIMEQISFGFTQWWYNNTLKELTIIAKKLNLEVEITWLKNGVFSKKGFVVIKGNRPDLLTFQNIIEKYKQ